MDKLASIRAFTKVVQYNGFAAAARDLRLSRSAVSKHVIELEEELGVQLLSRTTRSVTPTENGQAYYERCLAILADLEEADLAAARSQAEVRGLLGEAAPLSFGHFASRRAVADLAEISGAAHPAGPQRSTDRSRARGLRCHCAFRTCPHRA
jgi:DNA-binding transcriptional LysR family regulator